jgi:Ca2+-transporting ATPase
MSDVRNRAGGTRLAEDGLTSSRSRCGVRVSYGVRTRVSSWRRTWPPLTIFLRQFRSPLIADPLRRRGLAAALGETIDAIAILTIVLVNGVLGFVQEWRAERAIDALRDMLAPSAEVLRDGQPALMVPGADLVPGDLVILSEGQKVPADIALRVSADLRLDESALSGESVPVDRSAHDEDTPSSWER